MSKKSHSIWGIHTASQAESDALRAVVCSYPSRDRIGIVKMLVEGTPWGDLAPYEAPCFFIPKPAKPPEAPHGSSDEARDQAADKLLAWERECAELREIERDDEFLAGVEMFARARRRDGL